MKRNKKIMILDFIVFGVTGILFVVILIFPGIFDELYLHKELASCNEVWVEYCMPHMSSGWVNLKVITDPVEVKKVVNMFQIKYRPRTSLERCQCIASFRLHFHLRDKIKTIYMSHPFQSPHIVINHHEYPLTDEGAKRMKDFFESNYLPDPELMMNAKP